MWKIGKRKRKAGTEVDLMKMEGRTTSRVEERDQGREERRRRGNTREEY